MRSKDWKSLLFIGLVGMGLVACGSDKKDSEVTSSYSGIWADRDAISNMRNYGESNRGEFCRRVYSAYDNREIAGRIQSWYLNPYLVQSNGEVFTYNSSARVELETFRNCHYQGVVTADGLYSSGSPTQRGFEFCEIRQGVIRNGARFQMDETQAILRVFQERKNRYFVRTTPLEMDNYLALRTECMEARDQKADENPAADDAQDEPVAEIPEEEDYVDFPSK